MDHLTRVITRITCHLIAYRFRLENERVERRKQMAIEIKGLKSDALTARANIDRLRAAYAKFNQAAPAHAGDVEGLATQIGGMQSDLEFAATTLGNSAAGSSNGGGGKVTETPRATDDPPEARETPVPDVLPLTAGSKASGEPAT
jgi:hypothetical protein